MAHASSIHASYNTGQDTTSGAEVYYELFLRYKFIKNKIKEWNVKDVDGFKNAFFKISPKESETIISYLMNKGLNDYATILRKYQNNQFNFNDTKFIESLVEVLSLFSYSSHGDLKGRHSTLEYEVPPTDRLLYTHSLILFINPKYTNYKPIYAEEDGLRWVRLSEKFSDDFYLGCQLVFPTISALRRVINNMLEVTKLHPYTRCPIYDPKGKLVWPTKEELSKTY